MLVRIKHATDPNAGLSTIVSGPDERGGYMIEHKHLEEAKQFGWVVAHLEAETDGDEEDETEQDTQDEQEQQDEQDAQTPQENPPQGRQTSLGGGAGAQQAPRGNLRRRAR